MSVILFLSFPSQDSRLRNLGSVCCCSRCVWGFVFGSGFVVLSFESFLVWQPFRLIGLTLIAVMCDFVCVLTSLSVGTLNWSEVCD